MKKSAQLKNVNLILTLTSLAVFFLFLLFYPSQNIIFATPVRYHPPLVSDLNFVFPTPAPYAVNTKHELPPDITAASYLILDAKSDVVLASKNKNEKLKIASTTKLMTALTALDIYKPEDILAVKKDFSDGAIIGLEKGEKISADALFHALLIASANDAAAVLADNSPTDFVKLMNKKAKSLHLNDTIFSNPQGFDDGENHSTALDLALLASYSLRSPYIKELVRTPFYTIKNDNKTKSYALANVNKLLFTNPEVQGIKTGFTEEAGECLITLINKNNHEIIIVLLKSGDRFGETLALSDWVFTNFTWEELTPRRQPQQMP